MAKPKFQKPVDNDEDTFEVEDLDKVESKFLVPDGKYPLKVTDVVKEFSNAGNPMWTWTFVIIGKKEAGKEFKTWTALTAGALWKLVQVLVALGLADEKDSRIKFKKSDAIGRTCYGNFEAEMYNGRKSSKIESLEPMNNELEEEEEEEEEGEEEEPVKKPAKKSTKKTTRR